MNSILLASRKITGRFQREGVMTSFRYFVRRAKQIAHHALYDAKLDALEKYPSGVQRWVSRDEIVGAKDRAQVNYDAYPRLPFLWSLEALKIDPKEFSFVDFGSGRGRLILAAATLPFKRCVGVEFSKTLHTESLANIAGHPQDRLLCRDNISLNLDARDFKIPEGNVVAFFFNPLSGRNPRPGRRESRGRRAGFGTDDPCDFREHHRRRSFPRPTGVPAHLSRRISPPQTRAFRHHPARILSRGRKRPNSLTSLASPRLIARLGEADVRQTFQDH